MAKIHKLGYIQYMNDNNNNFSLIRNGEINRIGPQFIFPQFYDKYDVNNVMKKKGAYEDENYIRNHSKIWERDETTYEHKYCNKIINPDYDFQVCVIGFQTLLLQMDKIKSFQSGDERTDIIVLDNTMDMHELCAKIDKLGVGFDKVKCYALYGATNQQLVRYFYLLYRSCENILVIAD